MAVSANAAVFSWATTVGGNKTALGSVTSISDFSMTFATIDTSVLGDAVRTYLAGKKTATFTVAVLLDYSAHTGIIANHTGGVIGDFSIDFKDGLVSGSALVTGLTMSAEQDAPSTMTISLQVTGAVTVAASP